MRTLDPALLAEQKKNSIVPAVKIVFTYGETTYTIEEGIRDIKGYESLWGVHAKGVVLDNSKGWFTDKDLKGYQAVVYRGLVTPTGKKYSYGSPMKVTWQEFDASPGKMTCVLNLLGIPDLMDLDEANDDYIPSEDDTTTVKTLLAQIAGATLACFNHCQAYEIVWDNDENDDPLLLFTPKDSFRITHKGSRLAAFRRVLEYCACGARFGNDGKIHILIPTTSGEDYDYEYSLEGEQPFLSKAYRQTLVVPNKIIVESQKDDDPQYSGYATHPASYALLPKDAHFRTRLESNAQATSIAQALQGRVALEAEMGVATSLINCGAEVFDYVKVGAFGNSDVYRTGNIGWLEWHFNPEKAIYDFRFGFGAPPLSRHTKELYRAIQAETGVSLDRLYAKDAYIENLSVDNIDAIWLDPDSNIDLSKIGDTLDSLPDGENYARVKTLHLDAGQIKLDENVLYSSGYDPTEKFDLNNNNLDDVPEGVVFQRVRSAALTAGGLVLLDEVVVGTYGLVKSTDISAGHIKLSSTVKDGEWYDEAGVEIDAAHGINIYGQDNALTTRATKAGAIQCYVGSDGKLYAGAGVVWLASDGLTIKGQYLKLRNSGGTLKGYLYGGTTYFTLAGYNAGILLSPGTGQDVIIDSGNFRPYVSNTRNLGDSSYRFKDVYAYVFRPIHSTSGGFIFGTSAKAEEGSIKIEGGGGNNIYIYSNGAWRQNG